MVIDFKKLKAVKTDKQPFFAILLGPSGSGKSTSIGSLQKKTLFLHFSGETHGPGFAAAQGGDVLPVCLDRDEDTGKPLTPDQTWDNLISLITRPDIVGNFEALALDGIPELEMCLMQSKAMKDFCTNDKGKYVKWDEGKFVLGRLKEVEQHARVLWEKGIHFITTCHALVGNSEEEGAGIPAVTPKLQGFGVVDAFIAKFNDIIVCARVYDSAGKSCHKLIFDAVVTKQSKDLDGNVTKVASFSPRIFPLGLDQTPSEIKKGPLLINALKLKHGEISFSRAGKAVKETPDA